MGSSDVLMFPALSEKSQKLSVEDLLLGNSLIICRLSCLGLISTFPLSEFFCLNNLQLTSKNPTFWLSQLLYTFLWSIKEEVLQKRNVVRIKYEVIFQNYLSFNQIKFRYSGRTQKQMQEHVRENFVKRQSFQR